MLQDASKFSGFAVDDIARAKAFELSVFQN